MRKFHGSARFVAAASVTLLAIASVPLPAQAQATEVPAPLRRTAECMYEVLKTMPGVTEPKLGYVTREGWLHPFLEYRADEKSSWVQPTRFEAKRGKHGTYWLGILPGMVPPDIGHPDIHITEAVIKKWKTQCNTHAVGVFV